MAIANTIHPIRSTVDGYERSKWTILDMQVWILYGCSVDANDKLSSVNSSIKPKIM